MKAVVKALVFCIGPALIAGAFPARGADEAYPNHRINMVVGFAAGGFADAVARTIGQKLHERWGQAVTVENRAGAGGNAAAKYVATSTADGYTILVTTTALAINETLYKERDYKLEDLTTVAIPVASPETIAAHPSKPGSLREFLDWAKDREFTYATAGVGSGSHIVAEYFFKVLAKARAVHVPFRGGAPSVQAAVGNQVDVVASSFGTAPQINDGTLRGLAVASATRTAATPSVPTYIEAGYPGFVAESWVGFFVPAKTSPEIVQKLNAAINEIMSEPDTKQHFTTLGFDLAVRSVPASNDYLTSEVKKWGTMVNAIGVSVGQ